MPSVWRAHGVLLALLRAKSYRKKYGLSEFDRLKPKSFALGGYMKDSAQQRAKRHQAIDRIRGELMQCLDDLEQAVSQKRPLRLAYFICRLKTCAGNYFSAQETAPDACADPRQAEHKQNHATFRTYLLMLQEGAIQQNLAIEFVQELRIWGMQHFHAADIERNAPLAAPDDRPTTSTNPATADCLAERLATYPLFEQRPSLAENFKPQASLAFP